MPTITNKSRWGLPDPLWKWFVGYLVFSLLLVWSVQAHIFFWDTIQLGSKHAHFFYENSFSKLWLPDAIDSGHPPVFGAFLALSWLIFGKTLVVSHWVMLPFLLAIGWLTLRIGAQLLPATQAPWLLALLLADPVFMGQAILVSPDIWLMAFFLLGLWGVFSDNPWLKGIAALGLAVISTRGMMVVVALYVFESVRTRSGVWELFRRALPYVPSGLFALAFLIGHYMEKGWIGYHPDSPWSFGFQRTTLDTLPFQIALYGWRMLDFGRLAVWLLLYVCAWQWWRTRKKPSSALKQVLLLIAIAMPLLSITFFVYKGLNNHRYLLPIFFALSLLGVVGANQMLSAKIRRAALLLVTLVLLSGNLWVYPDKISQAWDCTLGHLPHYSLRTDMHGFLVRANIPLEAVGTAFPERGPLKFKDLSDRTNGMKDKDLEKDRYVLYSNVMNDFTDAEIDTLFQSWKPLHRLERGTLYMVLFESPKH